MLIILSSVLYTSQYYCNLSTWHQLSIYLAHHHLEGQRFNLKWPNLNKKLSKLPLTRFVLCHCKTLLVSSNIVSQIKIEKKNKYHTLGTVIKPNTKIVERGKFDTLNTQMHDRPLSWLTRYYSSSSDFREIRVVCSIFRFMLSVLWTIVRHVVI